MLEDLVTQYGYFALFLGTLFEGETILLVAGYLAERGYLALEWCIFWGFAGTFLCDQFCFFIGRKYGSAMLRRYPQWQKRSDKVFRLIEKYDWLFILSFRFLYGIRNISSLGCGMSRIPASRFFFLNMAAAALWAASFGIAGYALGGTAKLILGGAEQFEKYVLGAIVGTAVLVWVVQFARRRMRQNKLTTGPSPSERPSSSQ